MIDPLLNSLPFLNLPDLRFVLTWVSPRNRCSLNSYNPTPRLYCILTQNIGFYVMYKVTIPVNELWNKLTKCALQHFFIICTLYIGDIQ